ncbi:MAG: flagellar basal body rod protein FlgB [Oligoflexia bacterium]|nr:flagellar basal body rod protein FlgB [Oligoflexia bacterium]
MADLFDKTTKALGASLNYRLLRHNVTSSNIANAETPGYKAKVVEFEDALARAVDLDGLNNLTTSSPDHFAMGSSAIGNERVGVEDNPEADINPDKNTVDMDNEITTMSENSVLYKAALALINKKMAMLKYGITEGGK